MNYCPLCGENMSDGEDRHHGCSVMSTHVPDETFDLAASVVVATITTVAAMDLMSLVNLTPEIAGDVLFDRVTETF